MRFMAVEAKNVGFYEDIIVGLERIAKSRYSNTAQMAADLGVPVNQLTRWFKRERVPKLDTVGEILDRLKARAMFPDEKPADTTREVCFVHAQIMNVEDGAPPPASDDYFAVPLATGHVAAGRGRVAEDGIRSWVMVWRHHESVRFRRNLIAVEVGKNENSMIPTLHPGDIVLVDRDDFHSGFRPPGNIFLVREPDDSVTVKRVLVKSKDGDTTLTFYSDNAVEHPPMSFSLKEDFGQSIERAIIGRVVWSWSNMLIK